MPATAYLLLKKSRNFIISLAAIVLAALLVALLFPLDPWANIPQESVHYSEAGSTATGSGYYDWGGGARCTFTSRLMFESAESLRVAGLGINCAFPARSIAGIIHDVAASLFLPLVSLAIYLSIWVRNRVQPSWRRINLLIGVLAIGLILAGYNTKYEFLTQPVDGIVLESMSQVGYVAQLQRSSFTIGIGGVIGVIITQVSESIIERISKLSDTDKRPTLAERKYARDE